MRWAGYVVHMEGGEVYTRLWWEIVRKRDHLGDAGVDGRIVDGSSGVWTVWCWLRIGTGGGNL
jgi:hypothetical protein